MIRVVPPAGWVPPPADHSQSGSQISPAQLEGLGKTDDPLGGSFEDIDDILSNPAKPGSLSQTSRPQAPRPARRPTPTAGQSPTTRQPNRVPSQRAQAPNQHRQAPQRSQAPNQQQPAARPVAAAHDPVLPNEQWTSNGTRKRKRVVTAIVGVLGTLLILSAIAAAVVFNLGKPDPAPLVDVNQQGDPPEVALQNENDPPNNDGLLDDQDLADQGPFAQVRNEANREPEEQALPGLVNPDRPPAIGNDQAANNRPPIARGDPTAVEPKRNESKLQMLSAPEVEIDEVMPPINQPARNQDAPPKLPEPQTPFADLSPIPGQDPLNVEPASSRPGTAEVGMVESFESDLGELASLLEESGTSIMDFKDLTASIRTQQLVGMAKYVVVPPDPSKLNLEKQLELVVGGVMFDSAPLSQVINTLSKLTGVPITVDARSIVAAGKPVDPEISAKLKDVKLPDALTEILQPLGMTHVTQSGGLTVGIFPDKKRSQATFAIPKIDNLDNDGKASFVSLIQVLIDPESWVQENDPAEIELVDNEIVVNCIPEVQLQIQRLLDKLVASYTLTQNPEDAEALMKTCSRWQAIKPQLQKDPQLIHTTQKEIGSFLNLLRNKTGTTVLVDWRKVQGEEWTPQTIVPGNLREPTLEQTLAELARSMDLTFRAVNEATVVLTTFEDSAQTVDLEVYPLGKLVPAKLSPQLLRRLVTESLGTQLQSEKVRYIYHPHCQCLIVSAPQQLQRQIEGLVERLKNDLNVERQPAANQQAMTPLAN